MPNVTNDFITDDGKSVNCFGYQMNVLTGDFAINDFCQSLTDNVQDPWDALSIQCRTVPAIQIQMAPLIQSMRVFHVSSRCHGSDKLSFDNSVRRVW
jgi:hypothetical protein